MNFVQFFDENSQKLANKIAPDGMPRSAASHLGLFCLPMSHKRDARLKLVKHIGFSMEKSVNNGFSEHSVACDLNIGTFTCIHRQ